MKQILFLLTIVLVLGVQAQSVLAAPKEEVKIVTYYPTPDTEYSELDVQGSPRFAKSTGSVIIGKNRDTSSLKGTGDLDVEGSMAVIDGTLKAGRGLKLAKLATTTLDGEGEMWVE